MKIKNYMKEHRTEIAMTIFLIMFLFLAASTGGYENGKINLSNWIGRCLFSFIIMTVAIWYGKLWNFTEDMEEPPIEEEIEKDTPEVEDPITCFFKAKKNKFIDFCSRIPIKKN